MAHKEARMVSQAMQFKYHSTYILMANKEAGMVSQPLLLK